MFTGLIEEVGRICRVETLPSGRGRRLEIKALLLDQVQAPGASLAVDGVCLTITAWRKGQAAVEVGPETLERTTLGALAVGATVNLERPLQLGDRLGGHLVAGHVDGVGRVEHNRPRGEAIDLTVSAAPALLRYVVEKGSICVDGISLTVNRVDERGFDVSLIPHTQSATALARKQSGAGVNLEVDLIGKYVEKLLVGANGGGPQERLIAKLKGGTLVSTSRQRAERVQKAIEDVREGKMVILVDDEDRENEGDLTMAAEKVTPEAINFMAKYGRGLICLTLTEEKADALELPLQAARKGGASPLGTAFTVSIEARRGVTTGISARDRATTILTAVAPEARPEDLITPGHVFPLRAKRGGVLVRTGQTEGSVDLARLAGLAPAGVICEIMNDDGSMARMPDLERFAAEHALRILTIADLIEYRLERESLVERRVVAPIAPGILPAPSPHWQAHVYATPVEQTEYMALVLGDVAGDEPVLVRVQTACFPGDVFGSASCDCGAQLRAALQAIEEAGRGVFLYVHAAGRQSLLGDVKAHVLHETAPRVTGGEHKLRDFGLGAQVLQQLGVRHLRLLTNNPKKIVGLEGYGLGVVERVPIEVGQNQHNLRFLRDKRDREGHLFSAVRAGAPDPSDKKE